MKPLNAASKFKPAAHWQLYISSVNAGHRGTVLAVQFMASYNEALELAREHVANVGTLVNIISPDGLIVKQLSFWGEQDAV